MLKYVMPEYQEIDDEKHDYGSITEDDIWVYKVHLEAGIRQITADFYMENIYTMQPGDKPWFISIIFHQAGLPGELWHSEHLLKSLYFLHRDYKDEINVGFIDSNDELVREAFENRGIP
jgi:hypothetical protein